jgi:hypothetical protein
MTRSVEELRRESEQSRAALAATVDRLKAQLADTAEDIRHKVSPQHIKSEVTDYASHKARDWTHALKQRAMDNPMQALAAGTAVAVPVLRLAGSSSLPLLMIGAGLALTSKTVRDRAADAAAPVTDKAREMMNDAAERAQAFRDDLEEGLTSAQSQAATMANATQDTAADLADDLRNRAAQAVSAVSDKLTSGMDAAKDRVAAVKDAAATAPAKTRQVIGDNVVLVGGLGLAIGAIMAAAFPQTHAEAKVMGQASDKVKQAAGEAAHSGFEAAKDATMSAADAAMKGVAEADLERHPSRMAENTDLKEAAENIAPPFNPSRNHT